MIRAKRLYIPTLSSEGSSALKNSDRWPGGAAGSGQRTVSGPYRCVRGSGTEVRAGWVINGEERGVHCDSEG
eukprot:756641-Hanusia_phi.AAC.1